MEPISLEELDSIVQSLMSPTKESILNIARRKKQILANPGLNISAIMDILENNIVSTQSFLFIVDLLDSFLQKCFFRLPTEDILLFFMQLPIEQVTDIACINRLSIVIAKNIKLMYIHHDNWMIGFNEDLETLTDFDIQLYSDILKEICEPYDQISQEIHLSLIKNFAASYLDQLLRISISLILNKREGFLNLLTNVLEFGKKILLGKQISYLSEGLITNLQNPLLLGAIMQMNRKSCIQVLGLFAQSFEKIREDSIMNQLVDFTKNIISDPQTFSSIDVVFEFGKLLSSLNMFGCQEMILEFLQELMKAIMMLMNQNSELFWNLLSKSSVFLSNMARFFDSTAFIMPILLEIIGLIPPISMNCDDYQNEIQKSLSNMILIVQNELPNIIETLGNNVKQVFGTELTEIRDFQLCLFLQVIESILLLGKRLNDVAHVNAALELIFAFMSNTYESLQETIKISSKSEDVLMQVLNSYVSYYYDQENLFLILSNGQISQETMMASIFNRYINDISLGICLNQVKQGIINFTKSQKAIEMLCLTSFPGEFAANVKNLPPKKIVFMAFLQVMFSDDNLKKTFFEGLKSEVQGDIDPERLNGILKMMIGFFCGSLSVIQWKELYLFNLTNLSTLYNEVSNGEFYFMLLDFLYTITKNFPKSNPFFDHKKPQFMFIKTTFAYLSNTLNQISAHLQPIAIDDSIFANPMLMISNSKESIAHNQENDELWMQISKVVSIVSTILSIPCVNFGIMKLYNDNIIIEFMKQLISTLSATSKLSLFAFPDLIHGIAKLLSLVVPIYATELSNTEIYPEILRFLCVLFLSNDLSDIDAACYTLYNIAPINYENVQQHLVLAINAASNGQISESLANFVCLVIDNNREFFDSLIQTLSNDFPDFAQNIQSTFANLVEETVPSRRLRHFYNDIPNLCILIEESPSLRDFFSNF